MLHTRALLRVKRVLLYLHWDHSACTRTVAGSLKCPPPCPHATAFQGTRVSAVRTPPLLFAAIPLSTAKAQPFLSYKFR